MDWLGKISGSMGAKASRPLGLNFGFRDEFIEVSTKIGAHKFDWMFLLPDQADSSGWLVCSIVSRMRARTSPGSYPGL